MAETKTDGIQMAKFVALLMALMIIAGLFGYYVGRKSCAVLAVEHRD